jgi:hypothetical protein
VAIAGSCIFSDNQCQLDNPNDMTSPPFAVQISGQTIAASANRVLGGHRNNPNTSASLSLNTGAAAPNFLKGITVLGNITSDGIVTNGAALTTTTAPWGPLNILG